MVEPNLGLVVALPAEARAVLGRDGWEKFPGGEGKRVALPGGIGLICACSGVGITNAYVASKRLIGEGVSGLANIGVSGGLDPRMKTGDLIVAERILEDGKEDPSGCWSQDSRITEFAHEVLISKKISVHCGDILTVTQAVLTVEQKKSLYEKTRASAVDMESAGVARAAKEANIPFFSIRAVCDEATRSVSSDLFNLIDGDGEVKRGTLVQQVLRKPSLVIDLFRMGRDFSRALNALRRGWGVQIKNDLISRLLFGTPVRP